MYQNNDILIVHTHNNIILDLDFRLSISPQTIEVEIFRGEWLAKMHLLKSMYMFRIFNYLTAPIDWLFLDLHNCQISSMAPTENL